MQVYSDLSARNAVIFALRRRSGYDLYMLPWLLLALACHSKPTTFAACVSAECKTEVAVRLWSTDRAAFEQEMSSLTDPLEQVAVVEAVIQSDTKGVVQLCDMLPDGAGKERCEKIAIRPHLLTTSSEGGASTTINTTSGQRSTESASAAAVDSVDLTSKNVAQGPGMTVLVPSDASAFKTSPWDSTPPRDVDCTGTASERSCRSDAAQGYASAGKADMAGAICVGIDAGQWRWECMFNAAETAANLGGGDNARAAFELCLGAGDYMANCFAHAAMGLARAAPPSNTGDKAAWAPITDAAASIDGVLGPRDHDLSTRVVERLWSEATLASYKRMTELSGDPMDAVPDWVQPHVRAAAAWQLITLEGDQTRTLDEWGKRLEDVLSVRLKGGGTPDTSPNRGQPVKNLWYDLLPGEEVFTRVLYLSQARRVLGPTAADDRLICLLEAISRAPNRPAQIFVEALKNPTREVRWTAARIIQILDTEGVYLSQVRATNDPLLMGRSIPIGMGMGAEMGPGGQGGAMGPGPTGGQGPNGP